MKKLTILVDMDDTIENLCETWVEFLNETHGTTVHKDDIHDWDMSKAFPTIEKQQVYDPLFNENMWKRVTPLPGAVEYLKRLIDDGHKVVIVTASCKPHIALTLRSESAARGAYKPCPVYKIINELKRVIVTFRDTGPGEHRPFGSADMPSCGIESVAERIPSSLIGRSVGIKYVLRAGYGRYGSVLQRQIHTVIDLGPETPESGYHIPVSESKRDSHPRHVI